MKCCRVSQSLQTLRKPLENNHRGDWAGYLDKERKTQQQSLLHGMRMTAAVYMGISSSLDPAMIQMWLKQAFQHWCEQYEKLLQLRKESSIPGSVAPQDAAGVLFEKDDLQQAGQACAVGELRQRQWQVFQRIPREADIPK